MNTPRILAVDENPEIAQLEQALFQLHRYNVEVTVHPEEALRRIATRRYDVLVIGSPIIVGDRFFLDIVMSDFAAMLPATIIVTSHTRDASLLDRCKRAGVYAVISKPFDVYELAEVVSGCVANRGKPALTRWIGIPTRPNHVREP